MKEIVVPKEDVIIISKLREGEVVGILPAETVMPGEDCWEIVVVSTEGTRCIDIEYDLSKKERKQLVRDWEERLKDGIVIDQQKE